MNWSNNSDFQARLGMSDVRNLPYKEAFSILNAEQVQKPVTEARFNLVGLVRELGFITATSILKKLRSPELGGELIDLVIASEDGFDLKHPESQKMLSAWHDDADPSKLSNEEYSALARLIADKSVSRWLGLKPGHIQNARYNMTGERQEI